jgi:hypothetical protein
LLTPSGSQIKTIPIWTNPEPIIIDSDSQIQTTEFIQGEIVSEEPPKKK